MTISVPIIKTQSHILLRALDLFIIIDAIPIIEIAIKKPINAFSLDESIVFVSILVYFIILVKVL